MPELAIVNFKNRSLKMTAHLDVPASGAEGVVICQGGNMAGWSLYVKDNKPVYYYNWVATTGTPSSRRWRCRPDPCN